MYVHRMRSTAFDLQLTHTLQLGTCSCHAFSIHEYWQNAFIPIVCPSSFTLAIQMSWVELRDEVGLLSRILVEMPALEAGDRLGVLGRNSVEYLKVGTFDSRSAILRQD